MVPEIGELMKIGFSRKKAVLYLGLLSRGGGVASELAAAVNLKRPTVYKLLAEMEAEQLVSQSMQGNRRVFLPENPENLMRQVRRQEQRIAGVLPNLNELFFGGHSRPRMRFYEGVEGIRYVNEQLLTTASGSYFYFGSMASSAETLGEDYLADYTRRRVARKIWSNGIYPRSRRLSRPELRSGDENFRRIRYLPQEALDEIGSLTLFDNKIAVCSGREECYGLLIESADLYNILKLVWDALWRTAEP